MKNLLIIFLLIGQVVLAQNDEALVKEVVNSAYVSGIHNGGSIDDIRKGFHPTFQMLRLMDNEVKPLGIEEWITAIEKNRAQGNTAPAVRTEGRFTSVTVSGTAANVVLELYRGDKKIFTDNLLLYKFSEGWRIVSKTFYRHP
ncbi:MAG: nuclear transport factor 2 family protein [Cyclobacteriaceae bacterium]|nr:nuclear transport factor 2 family protein [Cyclobacteriaceae bacterium]